jgi:Fe-S cluster assembly ATP-binding protein
MDGARRKGGAVLREALRRAALEPDVHPDRLVDEGLSGGQRKRVELASMVAMGPRLLIADEPDSGIDVEALGHMLELFGALRAGGGRTDQWPP